MARLPWIFVLLATPFCSSTAFAHKMYVLAETDGATIHGEVYFRGGSPARDIAVTAFGPSGARMAQTTTDQDGKFTLEAKVRCDHRLMVQTTDGHGVDFTVFADELPKELPPRGKMPDIAEKSMLEDATATKTAARTAATIDCQQLESVREEIAGLRSGINECRKEIWKYQQQIRFRDIMGGIGWILGIAGIAFYFLGLRRKQSNSKHLSSDDSGNGV